MDKRHTFEAFHAREVNSGLYLHGEINEPSRAKRNETDPIRSKLKAMSWQELEIVEQHGFYITYSIPVELESDVKLAYGIPVVLDVGIDPDDWNRTHTVIGSKFRGLGLMYKCYKATVQQLGYITSRSLGSNPDSRNVWKYLIQDPMFYVVLTDERVLLMSKDLSVDKLQNLLNDFVKNTSTWKADEELSHLLDINY
jgi:hypothetical protein